MIHLCMTNNTLTPSLVSKNLVFRHETSPLIENIYFIDDSSMCKSSLSVLEANWPRRFSCDKLFPEYQQRKLRKMMRDVFWPSKPNSYWIKSDWGKWKPRTLKPWFPGIERDSRTEKTLRKRDEWGAGKFSWNGR